MPREFPGYWWLFWTQHLPRYDARLVEEERKKEERRRRWTIVSFDRFRLATLEQFLYISTATIDWGSLYKLFLVPVNTSICCTVKLSASKR